MGAMSGDLVRARLSDRDTEPVEGILHLRYVPNLDYVQVNVQTDKGDAPIDPASVEVIQQSVVSPDSLDREDPLFDFPGWRAFHDLDQAITDELVLKERQRQGGTWQDLTNSLEALTQPLIDAGWQRGEYYKEDSWEFGDSVAYDFRRNETVISVEYFEDETLDVYPVIDNSNVDDPEPTEPLFSAESQAELWAQFAQRGWTEEPVKTRGRRGTPGK